MGSVPNREALDEMCRRLQAMFECKSVNTDVYVQHSPRVEFQLRNGAWSHDIKLTFALVMELPAIFGSEHIDFGTPYRSDGWSDESGDLGGHTDLTLTVRWP